MPLEGIKGNLLANLLDLSADMRFLFRSTLMTDITLCVNGEQEIYCHKDVLKFRSKWFCNVVDDADAKGVEEIPVTEDREIMKAVLYYIYTGNLQLLESLDIPLLSMYDAAKKYRFSRLEKIIKRIVEEKKLEILTKSIKFPWVVKLGDCNSVNVECPALNNFTIRNKDKWKLKMKSLDSSTDDGCSIGIFLIRQTEEPFTVHIVRLAISIVDGNERRPLLSDKCTFVEDDEHLLSTSIILTKTMQEAESSPSTRTITLSCEMTVLAKIGYLMPFRLEGSYRRYISNELFHLSKDMYTIFKEGDTNDFRLALSGIQIHSYILVIRSRIPTCCLNLLQERGDFGELGWTSFAIFLYTGQSRYLDDHGRYIYTALSGTAFTMAKQRYSSFLAKNLTIENAFFVLCDAMSCQDQSLVSAASNFLACKSKVSPDPQVWIRIAHDKTKMIMQYTPHLYTFKQFLL